eukprot:UN28329
MDQLCGFLDKNHYSNWVIDKIKSNNINGKTFDWLSKDYSLMSEKINLDRSVCLELIRLIHDFTKVRKKHQRTPMRDPGMVDFVRTALPLVPHRKVNHIVKVLDDFKITSIELLAQDRWVDKIGDAIRASHFSCVGG